MLSLSLSIVGALVLLGIVAAAFSRDRTSKRHFTLPMKRSHRPITCWPDWHD